MEPRSNPSHALGRFALTTRQWNRDGAAIGTIVRPQGHQGASCTSDSNLTFMLVPIGEKSSGKYSVCGIYRRRNAPRRAGTTFWSHMFCRFCSHAHVIKWRARCACGRLLCDPGARNTSGRDFWNKNVADRPAGTCWSMLFAINFFQSWRCRKAPVALRS